MKLTLCVVLPDEFDGVYDILEENFVAQERRDREQARILLQQGVYKLYHICEQERKIGFISLWEFPDFTFAEHFVVYEPFRNGGYGSQTLQLVQQRYGKVVLEAEHPDEGMRGRRIEFYQRNGFCINAYPYQQPAYRTQDEAVPMLLLSYPQSLEDVECIVRQIYDTVYGRTGS